MDKNWDEINKIIEDSQPHCCSINFIEIRMTDKHNYDKVRFLDDEMKFPDTQPNVVESGQLFEKYLRAKYNELSDRSIEKIVHRYLFMNR